MIKRLFVIIRKKPWLSIIAVIYITGMITYGIPKSMKMTEKSDYYWVFWRSGKDFSDHKELYYREIARPFNYLPFAAFVFQPFHVLPLKISALIYFLINALILPPVAIYLIYKILRLMGVGKRKTEISLILATIFTLHYFWNNLIMFNINYILFVITLTGIYYLVKKKPHIAGILFTIITLIKIMPVLLAGYVFIFHFSRRVILTMVLTAVICLSLPIPFRGMDRWVQDHVDHYEKVIGPYIQDGRIVATLTNHNLKAGLVKTFLPESRGDGHYYLEQQHMISRIKTVLQFMFLGILILNGALLYRRKIPFSLAYLASILLFAHLISGLTWSAHLVTLMYCLLPVLLIDVKKLRRTGKIVFYFTLSFLIVLGFAGSDTFGERVFRAIQVYDLYTLLLVGLFLFCSWVVWSRRSNRIYPEGIIWLNPTQRINP